MRNLMLVLRVLAILLLSITLTNCSEENRISQNIPEELNPLTNGSGFFEYSSFGDKTIKVYYHIPANINANTKILFIFHGNGRNAKDYRNTMINKSEQYRFIIMVPEFSNSNFPGGDQYNLGNVYVDGDNPSSSTLNTEDEWTFSIIDPLFNYVKENIGNTTTNYNIFGHSAGGQFAHRFLQFKPNSMSDIVVASASGWYTVTNIDVRFPYGFKDSTLESLSLTDLFGKRLIVQVGDLDNDPSAAGLRHNAFADAQGLHRFERAQHFYNTALQLSIENNIQFNWILNINEGANHDYISASENAADLIFN